MITDLKMSLKETTFWGSRVVVFQANLRVVPYTRQTSRSRWRDDRVGERVREYLESRAAIQDALRLAITQEGVQPFIHPGLTFTCEVWLTPKERTSPTGRKVTYNDIEVIDLSNLEKALEDACNGILYPDDRYIWYRGLGGKYRGPDGFRLQVRGMP